MPLLVLAQSEYVDFLLRLGLDLLAIGVLTGLIYLRRHARRDLLMVYVSFNVGLFAVLDVITSRHIGAAVGFGLFAMLSIIRLRSEPFKNLELGYFFMSLVLALINGIGQGDRATMIALDALVLLTMFAIDHPGLGTGAERALLTLDGVHIDREQLGRELAARFSVERVELSNVQYDDVRETTRAEVLLVGARTAGAA
jgi:hypothetical protein